MPPAATLSDAVWPDVMVWLCGCDVIDGATPVGGGGTLTVIVAVTESADPSAFETRTQYSVVDESGGDVYVTPLAPEIGAVVWPLEPTYH